MFQLREIGRFFPLSEDGFIVNDSDAAHIDARLAAAVTEFYRESFGDRLHSVYVRGSAARGNAIPHLSDLDSFGVVDIDDVPQAVPGSVEASARLTREFPELADIVFVVVPLKTILTQRHNPFTFLLQTQSCCIHGDSLQPRLAPYRADIEIIGEALYLRDRIERYKREIESIDDPQQIRMQCTVLMKGIARSAYDLVLPLEGRYTRDLYFCHQGFVRHYPNREAGMRQAIEWAVEPISDKEKIAGFLSGFGAWLCGAVDELLLKRDRLRAAV